MPKLTTPIDISMYITPRFAFYVEKNLAKLGVKLRFNRKKLTLKARIPAIAKKIARGIHDKETELYWRCYGYTN